MLYSAHLRSLLCYADAAALKVSTSAHRGPACQGMLFIASDVVLLDPWAAVAAEYSCFQPPRAAFSLPEPYQRIKAAGGIGASSGSSGSRGALNSGGAVAAVPAPETAEAEQQGRRKRRRRRSYTPNEREEQAAARHAAYAPALRSAAAAVHDWLQRSGARTVHEALAGTLPAGDSQPGWSQRQRRHAVKQLPGAAACCPAGVGAGCGVVHQEADYLALYEARHDAKPKLRYAPEPACALLAAGEPAAKASGTDGTGRQRRSSSGLGVQHEQHPAEAHNANSHLQDVQQDHRPPQACNLFTHLISTGSARRERLAYAAGHAVLLPPRCRFLLSDARQLAPLLQDAAQGGAAAAVHRGLRACGFVSAAAARSGIPQALLRGARLPPAQTTPVIPGAWHPCMLPSRTPLCRPFRTCCRSRRLPLRRARPPLGEQVCQAVGTLPYAALTQPAGPPPAPADAHGGCPPAGAAPE